MIKIEREENGNKGKFNLYYENQKAGEMVYIWDGDSKFIIDHTEVGSEFGGKGLAKKLVLEAVAFARERNVKIVPHCSYAKKVLESMDEVKDLL